MSPIKLSHMSLTHPQTPINRSLPKAFLQTKTSWEKSWKTPRHPCHKQHQRKFKSTEALLESNPEASKNFNLQIQRTFEVESSKLPAQILKFVEIMPKSLQKLQELHIGEALRIQASKALKNFRHKPLNTKNIRREIIQIIFLDLKVH